MNPLGEFSECVIKSQDCIIKKVKDYQWKQEEIPDNCVRDCPQECDSINYKTVQSHLGVVSWTPLVSLNELQNMYLVVVYYPKFEYTRINQLPKMTSFDLVSLVGGTLGLFTGVGFFTLIDIIEIFLEMLGGFCVKAKKVNVNLSKPRLVVRLILQVEENPLTNKIIFNIFLIFKL